MRLASPYLVREMIQQGSCVSLSFHLHMAGTAPTSVINSPVRALNVPKSLTAVTQGTLEIPHENFMNDMSKQLPIFNRE